MSDVKKDGNGLFMGYGQDGSPVYLNITPSDSNPNVLISGAPGVGKGFALKSLVSKAVANGVKVVVVDAAGEYPPLAEALGGVCVRPGEVTLNPFDLLLDNRVEESAINLLSKQADLIDLLSTVAACFGYRFSKSGISLLGEAICQEYEAVGIKKELSSLTNIAPGRKMPTISSLIDRIRQRKVPDLANVLTQVFGHLEGFDGQTSFSHKGVPMVVYDLHSLYGRDYQIGKDTATVACTLYWLWNHFVRVEAGQKIVVLDGESLPMTENSLIDVPIGEWLLKRYLIVGRQYDSALALSTQSPENFESLLDHFGTRLMMRYSAPESEFVGKLLHGTGFQSHHLEMLGVGQGLISTKDGTRMIRIQELTQG